MGATVGKKVNVAADNCHDVKFKPEVICSFNQSTESEEAQTTCSKKKSVNVTLTEEIKNEDTQQENASENSEPTEEIENIASVSEGRENIPVENSHEGEPRTSKREVRKPNWMLKVLYVFQIMKIQKRKKTLLDSLQQKGYGFKEIQNASKKVKEIKIEAFFANLNKNSHLVFYVSARSLLINEQYKIRCFSKISRLSWRVL
ncbi:hypothetical protein RN001_002415 [Aquatica leii]|uniref:Uncharacterized protein n=1 Tax=Aquatica leii TaxID=1421715 RepID=A0AAN7Q595_9COLE|nr:hypothetical protein RN001_002415 [Aquatica leii]